MGKTKRIRLRNTGWQPVLPITPAGVAYGRGPNCRPPLGALPHHFFTPHIFSIKTLDFAEIFIYILQQYFLGFHTMI
jgi:hypothetical protein